MAVTSFKLASTGRSDRRKRITESYSSIIEKRQMISRAVTAHFGPFSLRGRDVAIDNGDAQYTGYHGKEYEWLDESSRKAEIQKEHSIFMRLSEIPTNELHKYLYLYLYVLFIIHNHLSLPD